MQNGPDIVGSVDAGILSVEWSPDDTLLVMITGALSGSSCYLTLPLLILFFRRRKSYSYDFHTRCPIRGSLAY
jgi:hypothetical protein